jgi:hypothetical protein
VFRRKLPNFLTGLLANLPLAFPSFASFQKYHLKHHAFQGVYELDADIPYRWEARLVGHSTIGKACAPALPDPKLDVVDISPEIIELCLRRFAPTTTGSGAIPA